MSDIFRNPEAEQRLVGTVLASPQAWVESSYLEEEQFTEPALAVIWRVLKRHQGRVGLETLALELQLTAVPSGEALALVGGREALRVLLQEAQNPEAAAELAQSVAEAYTNRELQVALRFGQQLLQPSPEPRSGLDRLELLQRRLDRINIGPSHSLDEARQGLQEALRQIDDHLSGKVEYAGLRVGFPDLDDLLLGLSPGDLVVIGSNTNEGKTILAGNLALNLALQPQPDGERRKVAFFSLEMTAGQMMHRFIFNLAKVSVQDYRKQGKNLPADQQQRLAELKAKLSEQLLPYFVFQGPGAAQNLTQILHAIGYLVRQQGVQVVFVDYLQLIGLAGYENRAEKVAEITRRLKLAAMEHGVPIIVVSQVTREVGKERGGRPRLWDLAESSGLEKNSDYVLLLWRPETHLTERRNIKLYWHNVAILDLAKARNRSTGICYLGIEAEQLRFFSLDKSTVASLRSDERQKDLEVRLRKAED